MRRSDSEELLEFTKEFIEPHGNYHYDFVSIISLLLQFVKMFYVNAFVNVENEDYCPGMEFICYLGFEKALDSHFENVQASFALI